MWFEHATSKMYTLVTLGEIVSRRIWTAARTLNPLALSRTTSAANSKALRLEHGNLVPEEPTEWVPKGLFSTIDGANAARWAWILLGIGEEDEVMAYVDWFVAWARDKSNHVPALQAYWQRTSWNLAMALRNNKSFGAAAKEIMDDVALWQEVLLSTPAPTKRTEKEILRTDGPHGTDDDIEEAQTGQGGGGGSWGRKRRRGGRGRGRARREEDGARRLQRLVVTESDGKHQQPTRRDHGRTPQPAAAVDARDSTGPCRRPPVTTGYPTTPPRR